MLVTSTSDLPLINNLIAPETKNEIKACSSFSFDSDNLKIRLRSWYYLLGNSFVMVIKIIEKLLDQYTLNLNLVRRMLKVNL